MAEASLLDGPEGDGDKGGDQGDQGDQGNGGDDQGWFWADGVSGEGDRPEWLQENHKTVEAQARGYVELEKKLGSFTGAPENYDLESMVPEDVRGEFTLDPKDPLVESMLPLFKELNMGQEAANKVVGLYVNQLIQQEQAASDAVKTAFQSMGANAKERIDGVTAYLRSNLNEQQFAGVKDMITSVDALEGIEALIAKGRKTSLDDDAVTLPTVTKEEVDRMWHEKDENGNRRVEVDPERRAYVRRLRERTLG